MPCIQIVKPMGTWKGSCVTQPNRHSSKQFKRIKSNKYVHSTRVVLELHRVAANIQLDMTQRSICQRSIFTRLQYIEKCAEVDYDLSANYDTRSYPVNSSSIVLHWKRYKLCWRRAKRERTSLRTPYKTTRRQNQKEHGLEIWTLNHLVTLKTRRTEMSELWKYVNSPMPCAVDRASFKIVN